MILDSWATHDIQKMVKMIDLNVTALAILSSLFVLDYKCKQTQLINVSPWVDIFSAWEVLILWHKIL